MALCSANSMDNPGRDRRSRRPRAFRDLRVLRAGAGGGALEQHTRAWPTRQIIDFPGTEWSLITSPSPQPSLREAHAMELANSMGLFLQKTNIIRDVLEVRAPPNMDYLSTKWP